ncbi:hypothetical protein Z517_07918 [Fonsecaea pedrosoi CBS 271.37]|uniref:Uncharacterized protein n=1 Tax=Fonsecaea pedrosoi CBS 271.37 TaxID=1442368 RepID=A0A0D2GHQ1_9EURO|nr:uncharacterized protein Z517_07918 [Fonsecaea pedrosoi CBS 271.37]KIW78085.1 hypothetical protein Z517_07918 [Fonsecaea pedrosoi CBS 271.37]
MSPWTTLPRSWELEDVQAVLNVFVTALSGMSIFVFTRCYWSLGARQAAKGKAVPVSSLLSLNTPGEAIDILLLLKSHAFQHWNIVAQSLVVIALSITTILSGPIAKYSTRLTEVVVHTEVNGHLAQRTDNSMPVSQVPWNLTQTSLERANFPVDQLLDYIPDTSDFWVYRPDEWNNTWSMSCETIESTPVTLYLTSECDTLTGKFGGAIEDEIFPAFLTSDYGYYDAGDFYTNATFIKDLLLCMYAANYSNWDEALSHIGTYRMVNMSMVALHVHHAPKNASDDYAPCRFGEGPVGSASYTRVDCTVQLTNDRIPDPDWIGFPDVDDVFSIPSAMVNNYFTRFKDESMADQKISTISARELQRFYQTYMITKDTQRKRTAKRTISVRVPAVQLSNAFIAVFSILAAFICLGGPVYGLFRFIHRRAMDSLPQTKLDWLLECIMSRSPNPSYVGSRGPIPSTVTKPTAPVPWHIRADRKRAQFEAATYSTKWAEEPPNSPFEYVHAVSPVLPDKDSSGSRAQPDLGFWSSYPQENRPM